MADFMELYSNAATTLFDQAVIYQHHPHHPHPHPIDIYFEKKADLPSLPCFLMDDNPSFSVTPVSNTTNTASTTAKTYNTNGNKRKHDDMPPNSTSSSSLSASPKKKRVDPNYPITTETPRPTTAANLSEIKDILQLQDTLDYLQDEWATIDIVLRSLKSAFTIHPSKMTTEEYLDEIDRELSIAYDDLMAQVRSLDRNLKRLDTKIKSCHTEPLA